VGYSKKDEKIEANFLVSCQADHDTTSITATTDILVGADGIWSRVRKCRYGQNDVVKDPSPLRYLNCIVILGIAPTPTSQPAHPLKLDDPNNPIIFGKFAVKPPRFVNDCNLEFIDPILDHTFSCCDRDNGWRNTDLWNAASFW
jgi:2-polyprenyl-6-methoxyphenol hydroxylase-like FAD-dependent oxidoreductase